MAPFDAEPRAGGTPENALSFGSSSFHSSLRAPARGSSRVEARVRAGQQLPSYPHFRASWQNGRQTLRLVSSTPSKIPYGGFSPVRLQARFRNRALHTVSCALTRPLFGFHNSVLGTSPWLGRSPNRRTSRFLSTTSPAVLGSLSGCSVRKGLRLL